MIYKFLASIDIDSQQCFTPLCPDELPVPDGHNIAQELNNQAKFAALRIGSKDAHSKDAPWVTTAKDLINTPLKAGDLLSNNIDVYWPKHAVPGTKGFELIPGLPRPSEYDFFIWKGVELDMHPYGVCYHDLSCRMTTGLIEYLRHNGVTHLVTGGLSLEFCVKTSVIQLLDAGFKVIVNLGATRGIYDNLVVQAKKEMLAKGAVFINSHLELPGCI